MKIFKTSALVAVVSLVVVAGLHVVNAQATPVPTVTVSLDPPTVYIDNSTFFINWSSTNATSCKGLGYINGSPEFNGTSGSVRRTISASVGTFGYGIQCTGPGGSAYSEATLTIVPGTAPAGSGPTVTIFASPSTVVSGKQLDSVLTWSSTGAESCWGYGPTIDTSGTQKENYVGGVQWNGSPVATSGSGAFMFPAPFTVLNFYSGGTMLTSIPIYFSIICKNKYLVGTATEATINVTPPIAPIPITTPVIITSPNAGDSWQIGSAQTITWTFPDAFSTDATAVARITLLGSDGKTNYSITPMGNVSNTGSYAWDGTTVYVPTVSPSTPTYGVMPTFTFVKTTIPAGSYVMQIGIEASHTGSVTPGKVSFNLSSSGSGVDSDLTAAPTVTITSPTTNSTWASGSTQTIRWKTTGVPNNEKGQIVLTRTQDRGRGESYYVAKDIPNTGSYVWTSVGTVYRLNPGPGTYPPGSCDFGAYSDPSCFTVVTSLPAGSYTRQISFGVYKLVNGQSGGVYVTSPHNEYGGSNLEKFNIGVAGSVSTQDETPPSAQIPAGPGQACGGLPVVSCVTGYYCKLNNQIAGPISRGVCAVKTDSHTSTSTQTSDDVALQQKLVQLITLLLQLVQKAATQGLLSTSQILSILGSIQIPR